MLGGQQEEGCRVVYHVQREHHQSYLWHHYQNDSIQDRHIYSVQDGTKCWSPISDLDKDMPWWNSPTLLLSQSVRSFKPSLGLDLIDPRSSHTLKSAVFKADSFPLLGRLHCKSVSERRRTDCRLLRLRKLQFESCQWGFWQWQWQLLILLALEICVTGSGPNIAHKTKPQIFISLTTTN